MEIISKKISFNALDARSNSANYKAFLGDFTVSIPKVDYTYSEIVSVYNSSPNNSNWLTNSKSIFETLMEMVGAEFQAYPAVPCHKWGTTRINVERSDLKYYLAYSPKVTLLPHYPGIATTDFIRATAGDDLSVKWWMSIVGNTSQSYLLSMQGFAMQAVQFADTSDTEAGLAYFCVTSDNKFLELNMYVNRSNSSYRAIDGASFETLKEAFLAAPDPDPEPDDPGDDPYNPSGGGPGAGYSPDDPIGGGGDFNNESDPVPEPSTPTISAVDCGFVTLYNPTDAQLNALSAYMWSDLFSLETLKKLFVDPMDIILGLMIVPVDVPSSGTREVTVGGLPSGVYMNLAAQQYIDLDCGTLHITPFFGSYLDYTPYTKMQLYLPFIGSIEIDPDEVMGRDISVSYSVDIATGACTAFVKVGNAEGRAALSNFSGTIYSFSGQCCQPVPVTGSNWNQLISSVVQVATTAITAGVGAAAAAGFAGQIGGDFQPTIGGTQVGDSTLPQMTQTASFKPVDHMRSTSPDAIADEFLPPSNVEELNSVLNTSEERVPKTNLTTLNVMTAARQVGGVLNAVMGSKPSITHTGSMSAVSGMIGVKTPYLIIKRPHLTLAETYQELYGYPANSTQLFGELQGFTKVVNCRLEYMTCNTEELAEIYGLLKEGVVF